MLTKTTAEIAQRSTKLLPPAAKRLEAKAQMRHTDPAKATEPAERIYLLPGRSNAYEASSSDEAMVLLNTERAELLELDHQVAIDCFVVDNTHRHTYEGYRS